MQQEETKEKITTDITIQKQEELNDIEEEKCVLLDDIKILRFSCPTDFSYMVNNCQSLLLNHFFAQTFRSVAPSQRKSKSWNFSRKTGLEKFLQLIFNFFLVRMHLILPLAAPTISQQFRVLADI